MVIELSLCIHLRLGIMTCSPDADDILVAYRERLDDMVKRAVQASVDCIESNIPKKFNIKAGDSNVEKVLFDVVSKEIQATVLPLVENLIRVVDKVVDAKIREMERVRMVTSDRLSRKLSMVEEKLRQLTDLQNQAMNSVAVASSNPFVDIEGMVVNGKWEDAFGIAVSVPKGIDFILHLIGEINVEEFFATNPVSDPQLALEVCSSLSKDLLQPDVSNPSVKIEMINELILNLSNVDRANIGPQFSQLRDLMQQLVGRVPPPFANRLKEILKIVVATERLVTPPASSMATPMPSRYLSSPQYS